MEAMNFKQAVDHLKRLTREGFKPKLLWHMRREKWYVSYIWLPKQSCFYELIQLEKINLNPKTR
jgi:hypothetical protein